MQRTVHQTTVQAIAMALEAQHWPGIYRDLAAEFDVGYSDVLAVAGHRIHQSVSSGVACGLPGDEFYYQVHDGYGSDGTKIVHMPVTCPDCLEIPVKISRGAGSPMVKIFPTGV